VDAWNSLPNYIVTANNTNILNVDWMRTGMDTIYDFRAQLQGTGNSEVFNTV